MTILDGFPHLSSWKVPLLCSDISVEMLERTEAGRYSNLEINRGLPASSLVRWFDRDGRDYVASDVLRKMITTRKVNLASPFAASLADHAPFDMVFLRNVLIYFEDDDKRAVLAQVKRVMHPEGWLFLGAAETTLHLDPDFERIAVGKTSAYRLKDRPSSRKEEP
jgi:chemotaxis protein methyltransferase CheR